MTRTADLIGVRMRESLKSDSVARLLHLMAGYYIAASRLKSPPDGPTSSNQAARYRAYESWGQSRGYGLHIGGTSFHVENLVLMAL